MTFTVHSSHGDVIVNQRNGKVIRIMNNRRPSELAGLIDRFDLSCETAKESLAKIKACDILDIGYWTKAGVYEPPVIGWREE